MQVFLAKPKRAAVVGPPEPPAPTLVQFDRNVVVLRGDPEDRPDQLTCDTLKLTLVPSDKPPVPKATPPATQNTQNASDRSPQPALAQSPASAPAPVTRVAPTKDKAETVVQSESSSDPSPAGTNKGPSQSNAGPDATPNAGLFGNLTMQRAHATGHAVWLSLPAQGIKLRCNELIHLKLAPKPDRTYFRGDLTRPLEIEKVDVVENEDDPDEVEITSVTHIRCLDATMFDRGNGANMDAADVVATGPGRLETRPGRDKPVERIAIWQDKLYLQNELGPGGQILRKQILLTGNRPCFIDQAKKASLDSAHLIRVWLIPKPKPAKAPADPTSSPSTLAGVAGRGSAGASDLLASSPQTDRSTPNAKGTTKTADSSGPGSSPGLGGGNFDIERLLALRDVHLLAPAKTITARERLIAEFVAPKPSPTVEPSPSSASAAPESTTTPVASNSSTTNPEPGKKPDADSPQGQEQAAAERQPDEPTAEPAMVGFAERVWVMMEMKPVKTPEKTTTAAATAPKPGSSARASTGTNAEIRNAWLWGSVYLHQDPAEGKTKGQEASGEAVYVDNRGEGQVISYVYQREPYEKTYLPGPLPPARVENDDKIITAAGVIRMNQATDQAWVEGPGTLTQQSERAPDAPPDAGTGTPRAVATASSTGGSPSQGSSPRPTSLLSRNSSPGKTTGSDGNSSSSKPKTRAGLPLSKIITTTIQFSEGMEFTGRTTDPKGNPAACGDFHGIVTALMEDALLHCEERMITYTDQVVPLAQLGAMSKPQSRTKPTTGDAEPDAQTTDPADTQPKPQLALIECYRNAVLINRDVDPELPILVQKKRVEAEEVLFYDKRTGDFTIPGKGKVFLYDRSDNSGTPGAGPASDKSSKSSSGSGTSGRIVTPTSGRSPDQSDRATGSTSGKTKGKASSRRTKKSEEAEADEIPSLVLTQITFNKGMRSQPGTGGEDDKLATHWYEFFGDVQLGRAKVPDGQSALDFDALPRDAVFLTGQTLRFITEPPPVGSPASTPARDYGKVWENAFFRSTDKAHQADMITADVITYDSEKDLVYAFGEGGRGITYAQQHADGQPATSGTAKALRFYPKTSSMDFIDNTSIQMVDKNTGIRPARADAMDPEYKPKKPPKQGFRIPANNMERRGFTGQ